MRLSVGAAFSYLPHRKLKRRVEAHWGLVLLVRNHYFREPVTAIQLAPYRSEYLSIRGAIVSIRTIPQYE